MIKTETKYPCDGTEWISVTDFKKSILEGSMNDRVENSRQQLWNPDWTFTCWLPNVRHSRKALALMACVPLRACKQIPFIMTPPVSVPRTALTPLYWTPAQLFLPSEDCRHTSAGSLLREENERERERLLPASLPAPHTLWSILQRKLCRGIRSPGPRLCNCWKGLLRFPLATSWLPLNCSYNLLSVD